MTPRSPLTAALERLLSDGAWHAFDDVLAALMPHVPPGRAYRRGEARRIAATSGGPRTRGDQATATEAGARRIADDAVRSGLRYGRLERRDDGAVRAARP